ncbi:hypothetical protein G7Y89_g9955 [Cudoniella acicularis]|uniref:Major facilitator superfamily (MFS) profile domain-containing protein n=1 Tax=Cudoniella acicularis TaxID=354080 RepID=A0A8H4VZM9_9HELO|nr:hypothetical protein G7Y89_g9955 [Cudoniella acicularis]
MENMRIPPRTSSSGANGIFGTPPKSALRPVPEGDWISNRKRSTTNTNAINPALQGGSPSDSSKFYKSDMAFYGKSSWSPQKEQILIGPYEYLFAQPGKDIRSQLIAAFNEWLEVPAESLEIITKVVGMLHTASLLVDDVEDSSLLRRGLPVAHSIFGTAQTINSANYVYFQALQELGKLKNPKAVNIYTEELLNLHRGQGMDLFWRDTLTCPTEDDYLEMVGNKTGGLFRLAIKLMQAESKNLKDCVPLVNLMGIIFQIRDDYQNISSPEYSSNKGMCEDLTEGKFSFPIIHSIRARPENMQLLNILKQKTEDEQVKRYAVSYMESTGSLEYCRKVVATLMERAKSKGARKAQDPMDDKKSPDVSITEEARDGIRPPITADASESMKKESTESSRQGTSIHSSTANEKLQEENAIEEAITTTKEVPAEINDTPIPEKDYSSFGSWEKKLIVLAATIGAFFSPFNAQIYFPALNSIAKDLGVTASQVNLTMTTYMACYYSCRILQATAPAFTGGFSDTAGRRPAYIICFVIYIVANIALALESNYVALLILRMVQSAGSSGTVALASAVVADVATSAERGLYISITSLTGILAPSLGPLLGGIISQYLGWKWIFWFLSILATSFFIPMLLFMPETCRIIVGDGSVPPPVWNRSLMSIINEKKRLKKGIQPDYAARDELARKRGPVRFPNPLETVTVAFEKEGFLILFFAGMVYAGFYAVIAGLPSQLRSLYNYDDLKVGLMFLPMAGGSLTAAFTQGRFIDYSFFREARRLNMPITKSRQQDLSNFPIEKARLQVALPMLMLAAIFTIIYGWVLHFRVEVGGICVVLFVLGYMLIASGDGYGGV